MPRRGYPYTIYLNIEDCTYGAKDILTYIATNGQLLMEHIDTKSHISILTFNFPNTCG
jgi:hypothetical protein